MKRTLSVILALCLLAALLTPAMAEEPVSSAVEAPVGEAWTAGAGNGLSVDGGDALTSDDFTAWTEDAAGFAVSAPEEDGVPVTGPDAGVQELDEIALNEATQDLSNGVAAAPSRAEANAGFEQVYPGPEGTVATECDRDPDALFAAYTRYIFYGNGRPVPLASNKAGRELSGTNYTVYQALKSAIIEIAKGDRSSTRVSIPLEALLGKTSFTAAELGVVVQYDRYNRATQDSKDRLSDAYKALLSLDFDQITKALWFDCTYEMYWYRNSYSYSGLGYRIVYDADLDDLVVIANASEMVVSLGVLVRYAGSEEYTVDSTLLDRVRLAVANAHSIVERYANCSDYIKLYGYAIEICKLVKYNKSAVEDTWDRTDTNPWQLIWVFDGDPD
ncbi:MAG: hypothetical protein IKN05_07645, partial [Clostridia bacterium]|nr:hypothetical protein [Clostridia bacterium]